MAAPTKKRAVDSDENHVSLNDDDIQDMLQVDFEGFNPSNSDYHGIKILLQQLFLKTHIDLGELTNIIISQDYIGSVIKQAVDIDMDESNDDDDTVNQVFGITTVIDITKQNVPCIEQLRNLLKQLATKHAEDSTCRMIENVLENEELGLIINERFVNIPAKISVPVIGNLITEIKRAQNKKMPFNFSHYLLICKLHKPLDKEYRITESKSENTDEDSVLWSNVEEETFAEEAIAKFQFCISKESDTALFGKWAETDCEMIPYRQVLLLEASKLQTVFDTIKEKFS
ncbi:hypothetical protein DMN91_009655 [Ooceraea biroi]|uniref:Protein BCCIP homolog n=1 Tax=Ooceraea biroi TaxID=2015173 RepID=A0A026WNE6_OOCBI|nr:protein BCCIP homolog [Ooceraea biroi]EZA57498.1 BCCIP-like protein [Ooceraea biroi]RLU17420.1 hypothetical protein DMN91_009655 [Ooceraea biroi]